MTLTPALARPAPTGGRASGATVGIREAARLSGVSPHTLRWYERVGLVPGIRRCSAGHRCFTHSDLRWIAVLRGLRETGMPVAALQDLTAQHRAGRTDRAVLVVRRHRALVLALIARLQGSLRVLAVIEADLQHPPAVPRTG